MNNFIIYKAFFRIESVDNSDASELLHRIVLKIRAWLIRKYNKKTARIDEDLSKWEKFISGGLIQDQYGLVECKSICDHSEDGVIIWSGRIEEKELEKGFAPRIFVSEIGFQTENNRNAQISFCVSFYDSPGFFAKTQRPISYSIPSVIRDIIEDDTLVCSIGNSRIQPKATPLSPDQLKELESLVFDPDRIIPIVFIQSSDDTSSDAACYSEKIVDSVYGNANVYFSTQYIPSEGASETWKNGYHCNQGTIRIYLGHVDRSNPQDTMRHRYFTRRNIEEDDCETVYRILNRVFCKELSSDNNLVSFSDYKTLIEKRAINLEIMSLNATINSLQQTKEREIDELKQIIVNLNNEITSIKKENNNLKEQIDNIKQKKGGLFSSLLRKLHIAAANGR